MTSKYTQTVRSSTTVIPEVDMLSSNFGIRVFSEAFPLRKFRDSYDAEARAALRGICAASSLPSARFACYAWLFIDNTDVARKLSTKSPPKSSQSVFLDFMETAKSWKTRRRLPHTQEGQINIRWLPDHAGYESNETADFEARRGAAMPFIDSAKHLFISLLQRYAEQLSQARNSWLNKNIPNSYARLGIKTAPYFPKELLLGRKALGQLIAARTGHGDFAAYHIRFGHEEARLNCLCGSLKTPTHFLFYRILRR
ncbi:hypothetical protein K3495_g13824 [Podosphaera aphanis]|nr:hypothetical protein K3495_g13824 [Podosphaera aphanis]